jgi:tRNA wybutosine-synthesizing protein 3
MSFQNQKKTFLAKSDKSKKGKIDREILPLINKINNSENYYTTSSCAGRIVLLSKKSEKKQDAGWLYTSHNKISFKQIKKALAELPEADVWLRFEPLILHVASDTIENAQKLINTARDLGFRKSGIQSTRKILAEIASTEILDTIVAKKGKLLITDSYLKILIEEANKKLERNKRKIREFYKNFQ